MYRKIHCLILFALLPAGLVAAPAETHFSVQHPLQVPGATLPAGDYNLTLEENALQDRAIVRLQNAGDKVNTLLLAVPNATLSKNHAAGIVDWKTSASSHPVLRGWVLPKGQGALEFAYPKKEAAALANQVNGQVLAVDSEYDHLPGLPLMSKDDMKIVHLWLLAYDKVGPNNTSKLSAKPYQSGHIPEMAANRAPEGRLPHTAGTSYGWMVGGFAFLLCAFLLRLARPAVPHCG